jgi:hypothetical protein
MDQDNIDTTNLLSYDSFASSDNWTDHVKWQGSQTACSALNQPIECERNYAESTPTIRCVSMFNKFKPPCLLFQDGRESLPTTNSLLSTGHHDAASSSLLFSHSRRSQAHLLGHIPLLVCQRHFPYSIKSISCNFWTS